jgi:hypothetical protein
MTFIFQLRQFAASLVRRATRSEASTSHVSAPDRQGKLSSAQAAREIALMEAIAADMRAQAEAERLLLRKRSKISWLDELPSVESDGNWVYSQ